MRRANIKMNQKNGRCDQILIKENSNVSIHNNALSSPLINPKRQGTVVQNRLEEQQQEQSLVSKTIIPSQFFTRV